VTGQALSASPDSLAALDPLARLKEEGGDPGGDRTHPDDVQALHGFPGRNGRQRQQRPSGPL
jgi:hypothetical protein